MGMAVMQTLNAINPVNDILEVNGIDVQISKCPSCEGKIKSPLCCGEDMVCSL